LEEDTAAPEIAEKAPAAPTAARRILPSIDEDVQSSDVNRLLAETDQQMDEPESATRRDTYAHLRAAVAREKGRCRDGPARDRGRERQRLPQ